jgi:uncharacterized protein (TIGR00369 family)
MPDAPDDAPVRAAAASSAPPARGAGDDTDPPPAGTSVNEEPAHLWETLGFRRVDAEPGTCTVEWDAPTAYCFPSASGPIVQGGLVTALLDASMGGATWSVTGDGEQFLTADLRVEFLRASRPGLLRATGFVVRRTRRVIFCGSELYDDTGGQLASSRCTQIVLPARGEERIIGTPVDAVASPGLRE